MRALKFNISMGTTEQHRANTERVGALVAISNQTTHISRVLFWNIMTLNIRPVRRTQAMIAQALAEKEIF